MAQTDLDALFEFLRFPSVSTDPAFAKPTLACAEWLVDKFRQSGLEADLHPTAGHPVVIARNAHKPDRRTLMIYGHYDVQPADPVELWTSPPFEPRLENGIIYARGATDNKGQILAHLLGTAAEIAENGELPLNIIYLVEGEEEIGSPNLKPFLSAHLDQLRCDVVAVSDTGMVAPGVPTFTYGLRGIAALELEVSGPSMDLHSGIYGGAVVNPATALARMISRLHDKNWKVQIDDFYTNVRELEPWEKAMWSTLPLTDAFLREVTGTKILNGEAGYTSLERTWARPTAELNGIGGGYQGEGTKTVLPSKAFAKLTFRLVPDQDPEEILKLAAEYLEKITPAGVSVQIRTGHSGKPYLMNPKSADGEAACRALRRAFSAEPALIREGGSIPIVQTFKEVLGVETLLLGLALPDCRAHSPNENFPVTNFEAGKRLHRALLHELATPISQASQQM